MHDSFNHQKISDFHKCKTQLIKSFPVMRIGYSCVRSLHPDAPDRIIRTGFYKNSVACLSQEMEKPYVLCKLVKIPLDYNIF